MPPPVILGIETSCDDTAAAVVAGGKLVSSVVSSQEDHAEFGGVVPELASRAHQRLIIPVVERAIEKAGIDKTQLDAVAVTNGPGLAGSLLVGLSFSKSLALASDIPLVGVNHLEGHIYSLFIGETHPPFPFLCLIVSGGHTELLRIESGFHHTRLGRTRDDAAGEAFDKVAKLLGLPYPGGPVIEKMAALGSPLYHEFPRTRLPGFDYSFSGIKTSVLYYLNSIPADSRNLHVEQHGADICAAFQAAMIDMLAAPVKKAMRDHHISDVAIVGGVSANLALASKMTKLTDEAGGTLFVPEMKYCMDNAAMIAIAGHHKLAAGITSPLSLNADPSLALS